MAEREAILGKAACLQACSRTVEANNDVQDRFIPVPEGDAPQIRVRGVSESHTIPQLRDVASDTPPCAAPARAILSNVIACGISLGQK